MSEEKKVTIKDMDFLLKEVYQERLNDQLKWQARVLGAFDEGKRPKPTFKQKWRHFWAHIPDFIDYIKEYKFEDWRYWDRDGF